MWYTSNNDWKQSFENKKQRSKTMTKLEIKFTEYETWCVKRSDDFGRTWHTIYDADDYQEAMAEFDRERKTFD